MHAHAKNAKPIEDLFFLHSFSYSLERCYIEAVNSVAGLDYFTEDLGLTCLLFKSDLDHTGSYPELKR